MCTGRKLNMYKTFRKGARTSCILLLKVQFTSYFHWENIKNYRDEVSRETSFFKNKFGEKCR